MTRIPEWAIIKYHSVENAIYHHIYHIHAMAIWPYSLPLPIQLSFIFSSLFVRIIANLTIALKLPIFMPAIDLAFLFQLALHPFLTSTLIIFLHLDGPLESYPVPPSLWLIPSWDMTVFLLDEVITTTSPVLLLFLLPPPPLPLSLPSLLSWPLLSLSSRLVHQEQARSWIIHNNNTILFQSCPHIH